MKLKFSAIIKGWSSEILGKFQLCTCQRSGVIGKSWKMDLKVWNNCKYLENDNCYEAQIFRRFVLWDAEQETGLIVKIG